MLAWKVLGAVMKRTGRLRSLIPNEKAIELSPSDAEAHTNLGITLQELGQLHVAMTSYEQAIKLKSKIRETIQQPWRYQKTVG